MIDAFVKLVEYCQSPSIDDELVVNNLKFAIQGYDHAVREHVDKSGFYCSTNMEARIRIAGRPHIFGLIPITSIEPFEAETPGERIRYENSLRAWGQILVPFRWERI